jgi:hypothetical protein
MKTPQSYKTIINTIDGANTRGAKELETAMNTELELLAQDGYVIINHIIVGQRLTIIMAKDRPE